MKKEYKIKEVYNPNLKSIEEKLNEVFKIYLTEKLSNTQNKK